MTFGSGFRKHLCRSIPSQSCTPMIPNMKNTKKHSSSTFPNIGRVSRSNMTSMRIPVTERKRWTIVVGNCSCFITLWKWMGKILETMLTYSMTQLRMLDKHKALGCNWMAYKNWYHWIWTWLLNPSPSLEVVYL